jgi:hypothetical protein
VRQVDKLEMAVQASEYGNVHDQPLTEEFIETARAHIYDRDMLRLLRLISKTG